MSDDIQNITEGKEDISNRASGYKATLSNPSTSSPLLSFPFLPIDVKGRRREGSAREFATSHRRQGRMADCARARAAETKTDVSDEAKKNAQEQLDKLGGEDAFYGKKGDLQSESAAKNLGN